MAENHTEIASKGLPCFILGGPPKTATSSLNAILQAHPDVFVRGENDFFTIDDVAQHPNYFALGKRGNVLYDYDADFEALLTWYRSLFQSARPEQKIGDYSTNYFASAKAPRRIHRLLPECKLIFMLRDPVARAYSEYWHHLKRGRVTRSFEDAVQFNPRTILKNSRYEEATRRYLRLFPRENIHFIVFERFIEDIQGGVDEVCGFLGLEDSVDVSGIDTRQNTARTPRWPHLQRWLNRIFQQTVRYRGLHPLLRDDPSGPSLLDRTKIGVEGRLRLLNLKESKPPAMDKKTRMFLEQIFASENRGLSELVGINLGACWRCEKL